MNRIGKTSLKECEFTLLSLNVRGLNDRSKRLKLFNWVKSMNVDIVMFQESYSSEASEIEWQNDWGTKSLFFSHGTNHSKGCLTLFNNKLDVKVLNKVSCENGRHIILQVEINGDKYLLANIYSPNVTKHKENYFSELKEILLSLQSTENTNLIIGGDWNTVLSKLDRYSSQNSNDDSSLTQINDITECFDLCDIWRIRNPKLRRYTYRRTKPLYQSRLDYWLISNALQDNIVLSDIIPSIYSDHSAILLGVKIMYDKNRGKGYWKFNAALLKDSNYVKELNKKYTIGFMTIIN